MPSSCGSRSGTAVATAETKAVDPNRRSLFVVGSTAGFALSALALHVVAALLFLASAYGAGAQTRVGLLYVLGMSSLVALLGVAAYLLSATMPLDVVIDDFGVTFAGAARPWRSIQGIQPSPRGLHVRSSEGDVWIAAGGRDADRPDRARDCPWAGSIRGRPRSSSPRRASDGQPQLDA